MNFKDKYGIVGRTGAGKSTITLALTGILETCKGELLINNMDIKSIPLN